MKPTTAISVLGLLSSLVLGGMLARTSAPQPTAAMDSLEQIRLGGVDQWILIRTRDTSLPVLLVLHGGPGSPLMPWADVRQATELEHEFVVVHWDQRGAGKSYDPSLTVEDLRAERFVEDTLALTRHLRQRFGQERIFLTGHSWGSALGFMTIAHDPSPFHAFVASGERVHWRRSHELAFEWLRERARETADQRDTELLEALRPIDATDADHLAAIYRGLERYRGGDYYTPGLWDKLLEYVTAGRSPFYTRAELLNVAAGMEVSARALEPYAVDYDLFRDLPRSEIPVHFLQGEHDHNTPEALSRAYHDELDAPEKSYRVIAAAGHMMMHDRPEAWAAALIAIKRQTLD